MGPHLVEKKLSEVNYRLKLSTGKSMVVHVNRIKPAFSVAEESGIEKQGGVGERVH